MKHGSLFSGIGGFDLAAEWMGWENVFHCEIEEFPKKILNYYWPNSISYGDIKTTDFSVHRGQIDILTGGFPCQPYSTAGKRLGKDDERHLWPFMLEAIRSIQPRWIVGENVRGIINWSEGLVFEEVQTDLEAEGYEVQAFILPAAGVNAPHRRDRVWFVAHTNKCTTKSPRTSEETESNRRNDNDEQSSRGEQTKQHNGCCDVLRYASDSDSNRLQGSVSSDKFGESSCTEESIEERLSIYGGQVSFEDFPTQSPICGGDDELPTELDGITFPKWRRESIKGYGNAVVPQLVFQIFKTIESYEALKNV